MSTQNFPCEERKVNLPLDPNDGSFRDLSAWRSINRICCGRGGVRGCDRSIIEMATYLMHLLLAIVLSGVGQPEGGRAAANVLEGSNNKALSSKHTTSKTSQRGVPIVESQKIRIVAKSSVNGWKKLTVLGSLLHLGVNTPWTRK